MKQYRDKSNMKFFMFSERVFFFFSFWILLLCCSDKKSSLNWLCT